MCLHYICNYKCKIDVKIYKFEDKKYLLLI